MKKETVKHILSKEYRYQKEAIKVIIEQSDVLDRTRYCIVSDEGLESVTSGEKVLKYPLTVYGMQQYCNANKHRGCRIEKLILAEDLVGSEEKEKEMLTEYFHIQVIVNQREKLRKLEKKLEQ